MVDYEQLLRPFFSCFHGQKKLNCNENEGRKTIRENLIRDFKKAKKHIQLSCSTRDTPPRDLCIMTLPITVNVCKQIQPNAWCITKLHTCDQLSLDRIIFLTQCAVKIIKREVEYGMHDKNYLFRYSEAI